MADEKELVYVPAPTAWMTNPTFWMGVASSLVATAIFWYFIHDIWPVDDLPIKEDELV